MQQSKKKNEFGVGLRHQHFPYLEENPQTSVNWFEAITENYFDTKGNPYKALKKIRENYPIAFHGVSLSVASSEDLNMKYLEKVKELYQEFDPFLTSDHLCWTGHAHSNLHNLLPFPYTDEQLDRIAKKVDFLQKFYGRTMLFENLSAYFTVKGSSMTEAEFINKLANKTGCKILFDINNVYVNSVNQKFDAQEYLDSIENKNIGQIHLAGFSDQGTHLFDTHSCPVYPQVWDLYSKKIKDLNVPIMVEWDEDIPDFPVLEAEMQKARTLWEQVNGA